MANTTDIIISGLGLDYEDKFRLLLNETLGINFLPIPMKEGDSTGKASGFGVWSFCSKELDVTAIRDILEMFHTYIFEIASYVTLIIDCDDADREQFNGIYICDSSNLLERVNVYMNSKPMTVVYDFSRA